MFVHLIEGKFSPEDREAILNHPLSAAARLNAMRTECIQCTCQDSVWRRINARMARTNY